MKRVITMLATFVAAVLSSSAGPVGFQIVSVPDLHGPALTMGIWYPTNAPASSRRIGLASVTVATNGPVEGAHLPLVILSHGQQGALGSHADTAVALADAGFVAAAPVHTGDNFDDQSTVGGPKWFAERTRHISVAIDYLLGRWPYHDRIDGHRIGLFGFSAGATTALIAIGGVPDFSSIPARCRFRPEFACKLWTGGTDASLTIDRRIGAAVVASPGFGFTFLPHGLRQVRVPVLMIGGGADDHVPAASNVTVMAASLGAPGWIAPGVEHFSFIAPCQGPPICTDAPGFDRAAFHRTLNDAVVRFFQQTLR